jgi:hypothetical protein
MQWHGIDMRAGCIDLQGGCTSMQCHGIDLQAGCIDMQGQGAWAGGSSRIAMTKFERVRRFTDELARRELVHEDNGRGKEADVLAEVMTRLAFAR